MRTIALSALCAVALAGSAATDEVRRVYLQDAYGTRIEIATLTIQSNDTYQPEMNAAAFSDHFLSMRPFKCIDGRDKTWCHVPYPYEIKRDISDELTDLEYDFLFVWKGTTEYGINMWNGIYYRLTLEGTGWRGVLHEMDMGLLAVPPAPGILRPLRPQDIIESEADSHWLPLLIIE